MLIDQVSFLVAMVICLTLMLTVFLGSLNGCIFPMLAQKAGFDPVVMASPFITTIVDALSLLIYFLDRHFITWLMKAAVAGRGV